MNEIIDNYSINHIEVVAAFDINELKVGKDLSEAIFTSLNMAYRCMVVFIFENNLYVMSVPTKKAYTIYDDISQ